MKKYFLLLIACVCSLSTFAQKEEISMSSILQKAGSVVNLIEREHGQEIVRMEFDIIQDSKQTYRTMVEGYTYGVCAFGDHRIKDIDVKVYKWVNEQWVLIEKDEDNSSVAMVAISPSETADYKIVISSYAFEEDYSAGHYGLVIFHE
jgi:hypothetical protein